MTVMLCKGLETLSIRTVQARDALKSEHYRQAREAYKKTRPLEASCQLRPTLMTIPVRQETHKVC